MNTAEFWVLVAFVIFVALFGKKVWAMVIAFLDDYIASVKEELKLAKSLNEESKRILADAKRKGEEINARIEEIKKQSAEDIKELEDRYKTALASLVVSLEKSFNDDIDFEISVQEKALLSRIKHKILSSLQEKFKEKTFDVKSLAKHEDAIKDLLID